MTAPVPAQSPDLVMAGERGCGADDDDACDDIVSSKAFFNRASRSARESASVEVPSVAPSPEGVHGGARHPGNMDPLTLRGGLWLAPVPHSLGVVAKEGALGFAEELHSEGDIVELVRDIGELVR
jgi:hypothetical protein